MNNIIRFPFSHKTESHFYTRILLAAARNRPFTLQPSIFTLQHSPFTPRVFCLSSVFSSQKFGQYLLTVMLLSFCVNVIPFFYCRSDPFGEREGIGRCRILQGRKGDRIKQGNIYKALKCLFLSMIVFDVCLKLTCRTRARRMACLSELP